MLLPGPIGYGQVTPANYKLPCVKPQTLNPKPQTPNRDTLHLQLPHQRPLVLRHHTRVVRHHLRGALHASMVALKLQPNLCFDFAPEFTTESVFESAPKITTE